MTTETLTPGAHLAERRSRRSRHRVARVAAVIGWLVVLPLVVLAAARVVAWDDDGWLVIVNSITAIVYLPAWPVAVFAAIGRRRALAAAAVLVVVAQLVFLAPELLATHSLPTWAASAPSMRIFDANVYFENSSLAGYIAPIRRERPDLVTLEEASPGDYAELEQAGMFAHLPYRLDLGGATPSGFVIASRYPLVATHVVTLFDEPLIVQLTLALPQGRAAVWVVHTVAPLPPAEPQWAAQLTTIADEVRRVAPAHLVVLGDFNATWGNKDFRRLLDAGLTDGAAARGKPFLMTWSQMMPPLPPFARIDHVLTGNGVAVTTIGAGDGPGSDHRYVTATVAFQFLPGRVTRHLPAPAAP